MTVAGYWFVLLLIVDLVWSMCVWRRRQPEAGSAAVTTTMQRVLKPRTPNDCPACRHQSANPDHVPACLPVRPWSELKSRRGAPKRIATEGFACPRSTWMYYQITDGQVHALVGDGSHGKHERIQTFRCQACTTTFSARRHTPLYRLTTTSQRVGEVLTALAEGLDVAAAARVCGHGPATITTWLTRAGEHSAALHHRWFRNLQLRHVQLDEIRTRLRSRTHVLWLWLAVDPLTKLIPALQLGTRTQDAAHAVVHDLRQRLAPGCTPVFTSDGLNVYFYALTAHFGEWIAGMGRRAQRWQVATRLIYGQVQKVYRRRNVVRVTHVMRCGTHEQLCTALQRIGLSGRLNTAFVERVNLTIRQSVAALVRRTCTQRVPAAQDAPQVLAHLEWWRG